MFRWGYYMEPMKSFDEKRAEASELVQKLKDAKEQFIRYNVDECGGDYRVIKFIADILFHGARDVSLEDSTETIRYLFEAGYCYYFAEMLEEAFPGGVICMCYDFGHIVYVYEEIAYDIHGVSDAEAMFYAPIDLLGKGISSFKHVPEDIGNYYNEKLRVALAEYGKKTGGIFALSENTACKEIVKRCKAVIEQTDENNEYSAIRTDFHRTMQELSGRAKSGDITWEQYRKGMIDYCHSKGLSWCLIKRLHKRQKELNL